MCRDAYVVPGCAHAQESVCTDGGCHTDLCTHSGVGAERGEQIRQHQLAAKVGLNIDHRIHYGLG